jgi:DNA-binding response OmpR family regulator
MNEKILIIDDDEEFASELSTLLSDEGYVVTNTNDPEKGAVLLKEEFFNLVILDYKMPRINGILFLKNMEVFLKKTKIIIISGSLEIENLIMEEGLVSYIDLVFSKPFIIDEFLSKINALLPVKNQ